MTDEHAVDRHLVAVLNEILDVLYQAKQASWAASTSSARVGLQELVSYLIDQSRQFMVAEERIDGRSADVTSPSSHQRGNLLADANGDLVTAVSLLTQRIQAIADDARARAATIADAAQAPMLVDLADGLETRIGKLRSS